MKLIDLQEAADMMDIPVVWVNGMIELGKLAEHEGLNGIKMVDADEIIVKRYASKEFEMSSVEHIQSMLKKFIGENRTRAILG